METGLIIVGFGDRSGQWAVRDKPRNAVTPKSCQRGREMELQEPPGAKTLPAP